MSCNREHSILLLALEQAEFEKGLFLGQAGGKPCDCLCSALSWSMNLYWFRSLSLQEINPELKWGTLIVPRGSCFWVPLNGCKTRAFSQVNLQPERGKPAHLCFVKTVRNFSCLVFAKGRVNTPIPVQETQHKCSIMCFGSCFHKALAEGFYLEVLVRKFGAALLVLNPLCCPAAVAPMPPGSPLEQRPFQRASVPPAMTECFFFWCCASLKAPGAAAGSGCRCVCYGSVCCVPNPDSVHSWGWLEAACRVVGHSDPAVRAGWAGIPSMGQQRTAGPSWDRQSPHGQNCGGI